MNIWKYFLYALYPGIIIHELSHLLIIQNLNSVRATEVNLLSHVKHEGYYTVSNSFLISYAPFIIHTLLVSGLIYLVSSLDYTHILHYIFVPLSLYLIFILSFTAFPSYVDAVLPLKIMRKMLFTRQFMIILLIGPIYLLISIPVIGLTYVFEKSLKLKLIFAICYIFIICYLILFNPSIEFINSLEELLLNY